MGTEPKAPLNLSHCTELSIGLVAVFGLSGEKSIPWVSCRQPLFEFRGLRRSP